MVFLVFLKWACPSDCLIVIFVATVLSELLYASTPCLVKGTTLLVPLGLPKLTNFQNSFTN